MINFIDATQNSDFSGEDFWSTCPEEFLLSDSLDAALDFQVDRASEIISNMPKLPTTKSLDGAALATLLMGSRVSHLAFQGDTNSYCLRAPIYNLREAGWPIDDCWNAGDKSRFSGKRTKYKKYFISDENLQRLRLIFGERLNLFIDAVNSLHDKEV
ncbi:MAG: hypothetical protein Q8L15_07600 [Methylobacter sp.]|nr:hypothetical protein [Methylobacter sp.]